MAVRILAVLFVLAAGACGDRSPSKKAPVAAAASDAAVAPDARAEREIIDRTAEATAILSNWDAPDGAEKIHAMANPKFQKSVTVEELKLFHDDFAAKMGTFVAVKSSQGIIHKSKTGDTEDVVRGLVAFERGEAPYELVLVELDGTRTMLSFKLELPPALQTPPDRAQARALATAFNQALLAVDVAKIDEVSLPRIRGQLAPEDVKRMRDFVKSLGARPKLEVDSDRECGDALHCLKYRVTGPSGRAVIEQTLSAPLGRWRVVNWKFEPHESKPEENHAP